MLLTGGERKGQEYVILGLAGGKPDSQTGKNAFMRIGLGNVGGSLLLASTLHSEQVRED